MTVSCNPGDILSDGQFRIDHVDQDTGTIADDVTILSSQLSGLGVGTWKGVIRNDAAGRAQAKAFIVCLPKETEAADRQTGYGDSHKHPLSADPTPVTHTATYGAGRHTATLTCPSGTIPIAPGFDAPAGGRRARGLGVRQPRRGLDVHPRRGRADHRDPERALPAHDRRPGVRPHPRAALHPRRATGDGPRPHGEPRATSSR